jgi:hypothetical protein
MRIRAGMVAVLGAALALNCGGESTTEKTATGNRGGAGGSGHAGSGMGAGAGTSSAGTGACSDCGEAGAGASDGTGGSDVTRGGSAGKAQGGSASGGFAGEGAGASARAGSGADGGSGGKSGSGSAGKAGAGGTAGGSAGDSAAGAPNVEPDDTLKISKVALYQAVEIPLMADGVERPANANAPLVAARDAMLRVWLAPGNAFVARDIVAQMTVTLAGGASRTAELEWSVSGSSRDADLDTTLNFNLDASEVAVSSTVVVELHEVTTGAELLARYPTSSARVLAAQSSSGPFLVTLVPLVANGFTPDTGESNRVRYERYMSQIYPAASAEVTVTEPLVLDYPVDPDGSGWDEALDQLLAQRDADHVEPNVYYYGLLTPGATFDSYCQNDCVVGLSNVATRSQEQYRGAVGTGYFTSSKDTFSQETMAHELGHALGREHSPCQTDDYEAAFPYHDGKIGVFGYNGTRLYNPATYTDVMGYCVPVWIIDFTYDHVFERIVYVNGLANRRAPAQKVVTKAARTLRVGLDGRLTWGREHAVTMDDEAQTTDVELLDANGGVVRSVNVVFTPLDHLPGGSLSIPAEALADPEVARVRVGRRTIDVF